MSKENRSIYARDVEALHWAGTELERDADIFWREVASRPIAIDRDGNATAEEIAKAEAWFSARGWVNFRIYYNATRQRMMLAPKETI